MGNHDPARFALAEGDHPIWPHLIDTQAADLILPSQTGIPRDADREAPPLRSPEPAWMPPLKSLAGGEEPIDLLVRPRYRRLVWHPYGPHAPRWKVAESIVGGSTPHDHDVVAFAADSVGGDPGRRIIANPSGHAGGVELLEWDRPTRPPLKERH